MFPRVSACGPRSARFKREDSFIERVKIGMAAEHPSDRVYWVPRPAWERVMHPKNRRTC
jgi:hypothetical protein